MLIIFEFVDTMNEHICFSFYTASLSSEKNMTSPAIQAADKAQKASQQVENVTYRISFKIFFLN